jgi:uncharacterized protein HemX
MKSESMIAKYNKPLPAGQASKPPPPPADKKAAAPAAEEKSGGKGGYLLLGAFIVVVALGLGAADFIDVSGEETEEKAEPEKKE